MLRLCRLKVPPQTRAHGSPFLQDSLQRNLCSKKMKARGSAAPFRVISGHKETYQISSIRGGDALVNASHDVWTSRTTPVVPTSCSPTSYYPWRRRQVLLLLLLLLHRLMQRGGSRPPTPDPVLQSKAHAGVVVARRARGHGRVVPLSLLDLLR